jgi:hypothetical protein
LSHLWVKIDYAVAGTIIKGLRQWLDKMEDLLDKAVLNKETNQQDKEE